MLLLILTMTIFGFAESRPEFAAEIPNGDKVPNPCNILEYWPAVGHLNPSTGNANKLNPFGTDFRNANYEWSIALCMADSDNDGKTNGEELGDPDCIWTKTNGFPDFDASGHPGFVDTDSSLC